ncbi:hypothetical protein COCON_G00108610 [Conger conger]|uniref:Uncharacterized protein n=1 Tax=Conger conger TaxID=82655 RepID=A0A9Q1DJ55_CONCO|nr:hepatitis A virus cellular receptor 1-like isoform X2 [Conger conger]KAJ8272002.1 hypothetical protein COCON_G00108610 [Conger conger]
MKPAEAACCLLLITLQLGHTGSTVNPARAGESEELDALLKKFLEVKDEVVRREMKVILKALLRVFSHCKDQLITTTTIPTLITSPSATTASPTTTIPTPITSPSATTVSPTTTIPTLITSASATTASLTARQPANAETGNQHIQRHKKPPVMTGESASPDDNQGKEKSQESPKSDRKFLWIVLGVLAAIMLVTILILKSKVLICVRVHTKADVADYMEEKMYSKNDDIVLLGVTPGPEWEEECYFTAKGCDGPMSQCAQQGSPGCEVISPRSTY